MSADRRLSAWIRRPDKGCVANDGVTSYHIRGPIMGQKMYWLYTSTLEPFTPHGRYTPTGRYEDVVNFPTLKAAKKYVETLATTVNA